MENGDQQLKDGLHWPNDEEKRAHHRNEGQHPISRSARQQKRREKLHGDDHFGAEKKYHFDGGFPGAGDEKEHAARGDRGDEDQPEARQEAEAERAAAAFHMEARLDFCFESVEMVMDASGVDAAELAIGAV